MRFILFSVVGFALGFACHWAVSMIRLSDAAQVKRHWQAIDAYKAYMNEPQNAVIVDGMVGVRQPTDLGPHLAALVALGKLRHVDLVLPNVPNTPEARQYWMQYVEEHDDIIWSMGNPHYSELNPSGPQPLHLRFWFRPGAEHMIQRLIATLESMGATDSTTNE